MRLGILAGTHDEPARTRLAVEMLHDDGAEVLIHCGDLAGAPIVEACSKLPFWFVFGNHDADSVPELATGCRPVRRRLPGLGRGG